MTRGRSRLLGAAAAAVAVCLVAAGCGGAKVGGSGSGGGSGGGDCSVNMAINNWVGYEADAAVLTYLAEKKLGCTVKQKTIKEQIAWQGFASDEVDVVLENWGHADLVKKYIDQDKVAVDGGQTGNKGIIGWYVPPWMAKKYPDITNWKNLNKYAKLFRTSESGSKGQFLDGDPAFVTNDAALVKNLKLNYKVVYAGSEAALIQGFRKAEKNKTPMIGYFYEPQWFFTEVKLVHVKLPTYKSGCDADPQKVACDYPPYNLNKVFRKKFVDQNSKGYQLIKNFRWTNDDQNQVSEYIAVDKMSDDAAAKKWLDANPDKWKAWMPKGS